MTARIFLESNENRAVIDRAYSGRTRYSNASGTENVITAFPAAVAMMTSL